jgi:hypothetical protein
MPIKYLDSIKKITEINLKTSELSKMAKQMSFVPESIQKMIERQNKYMSNIPEIEIPKYNFSKLDIPNFEYLNLNIPKLNIPKFDFANSELLETLKKFSKIGERIKNNPELQFVFISDLEVLNLKSAEEFKASLISDLTDEDIKQKDELLNDNLIPYLEELGIDTLWIGANNVLESQNNPDKLRHCLISLRTILEYLIDEKLAPIEELKNNERFKKEFKRYHLGKQKLEYVKVKRADKIEYFTSKIEFGMLEEFTKNEIQYVCDCYSVLCNVHQPNIGITENQVRSLKVKTGITIWLLVYLNDIIKN